MIKLLHFADAHIDIAIEEQVNLVIFAGDTYKDRNPVPNPISREAMMKTSWKVNSTKRKSSL